MGEIDSWTSLKQSGKSGDRHTCFFGLQVTKTNSKQLIKTESLLADGKYCVKFKVTVWGQPNSLGWARKP